MIRLLQMTLADDHINGGILQKPSILALFAQQASCHICSGRRIIKRLFLYVYSMYYSTVTVSWNAVRLMRMLEY